MQASKNEIHLDFANNPDLAALFANKKAGDKCTIEVTLQVKEADEKRVIGTIEKVASEYGDDEKTAEPSPEAPMFIKMAPALKNG